MPGSEFDIADRIISTTVFHWFTPTEGNLWGAWPPLEGRANWTGETSWWISQIKQMMMAHIDIIYIHLIEKFEQQRINLFAALAELRSYGYDVPKVAPFLDPLGIWPPKRIDVTQKAGKDELIRHYVRFFEQYFSVNRDPYAASYLAKIDRRVVLSSWWTYSIVDNVERLRREDIEDRLHTHFKSRTPVFGNGIYFVANSQVNPDFSFADERAVFFSGFCYAMRSVHNRVHVYHLQPGYWDQNLRHPGYHLPRLGGQPYREAWEYLLSQSNPILRVYIESWNEYDESSGIYAADPHTIHRTPSNKSPIADCWSTTGDPFEYIRTTARGAGALKNIPGFGSNVMECPKPIACRPLEKVAFWITFRNTGALAWNVAALPAPKTVPLAADFGNIEMEPDPTICRDLKGYGGVFRGAPLSYHIELDAPGQVGAHLLRLRLHNSDGEAFGDAIEIRFDVQ